MMISEGKMEINFISKIVTEYKKEPASNLQHVVCIFRKVKKILIVRMKTEREINKKEMFLARYVRSS